MTLVTFIIAIADKIRAGHHGIGDFKQNCCNQVLYYRCGKKIIGEW
jgi:hypothetical protein